MKVSLKNIGVMREANFEIGELTVICGRNNTGKTYATYALYGFLHQWHDRHDSFGDDPFFRHHYVSRNLMRRNAKKNNGHIFFSKEITENEIIRGKTFTIDILNCKSFLESYIADFCRDYKVSLPKIFASSDEYFGRSYFSILSDSDFSNYMKKINFDSKDTDLGLFSLSKKDGKTEVKISIDKDAKGVIERIGKKALFEEIDSRLIAIILSSIFPRPFISSAERTGVATFKKQLNFALDKLVDEMSSIRRDADLAKIYRKNYSKYALPIHQNVDFVRGLEDIAKNDSFIFREHKDILDRFSSIIGGDYTIEENDMVYYTPSKSGKAKLTVAESSSGVRSLLDLGCYLRHEAKIGDLLMIDEPELNLHPENQRLVARLFAQLANIGIKVFITTHSDFVTSELSTLILLNSEDKKMKDIAKEYGYDKKELLSHDRVKLYTAVDVSKKSDAHRSCELQLAKIDKESGIDADVFNKTIDEMNEIKEKIFLG